MKNDYVVVNADDVDTLQREVNKKLDNGYTLHEGLIVVNYGERGNKFAQVVVKLS